MAAASAPRCIRTHNLLNPDRRPVTRPGPAWCALDGQDLCGLAWMKSARDALRGRLIWLGQADLQPALQGLIGAWENVTPAAQRLGGGLPTMGGPMALAEEGRPGRPPGGPFRWGHERGAQSTKGCACFFWLARALCFARSGTCNPGRCSPRATWMSDCNGQGRSWALLARWPPKESGAAVAVWWTP